MRSPGTTRFLLFCATLAILLGVAPWLASRDDARASGVMAQICTSLGILQSTPPAVAPSAHQHP